MDHERFTEGNDTLLGSGDRTLEEEEVILDYTVVRETTQGSDGFLGDVVLGRGVVVLIAETNAIDFLVNLRSVVVTVCETKGLCT